MGFFKDIITNFQENRTERVQARQEARTERQRARQERRTVESLTGRSSGSGEAWAQSASNFTSSLMGMFTGGASSVNRRPENSGSTKSEPQDDNSFLIYAGVGLAVVVVIALVLMKKK